MTDPLCAAVALDRECGASLVKLAQWYGLPASEIERLLCVADYEVSIAPLNLVCRPHGIRSSGISSGPASV